VLCDQLTHADLKSLVYKSLPCNLDGRIESQFNTLARHRRGQWCLDSRPLVTITSALHCALFVKEACYNEGLYTLGYVLFCCVFIDTLVRNWREDK